MLLPGDSAAASDVWSTEGQGKTNRSTGGGTAVYEVLGTCAAVIAFVSIATTLTVGLILAALLILFAVFAWSTK